MYPTTGFGRFIGALNMVCGILVLALPISIIGSSFSDEYEKELKRQKADKHGYDESADADEPLRTGDFGKGFTSLMTEIVSLRACVNEQQKVLQEMHRDLLKLRKERSSLGGPA